MSTQSKVLPFSKFIEPQFDVTETDENAPFYLTLKPSLGATLGRVHRLWRTAVNNSVRKAGINESRWLVMITLEKIGEGCTQQALANELCIEMPSLTRTLNQLEDQQLVERRRDPSDRRVHRLWLTEKGTVMNNKITEEIRHVREAVLVNIDEARLNEFASMLVTMEDNARALLKESKA